MEKKYTRCWTNGDFIFPSVYGVKNFFASELIMMGDIKVFNKTKALKNPAKFLESTGWRWEKYEE